MWRVLTGGLAVCLALGGYGLVTGTRSLAPTPLASAEVDEAARVGSSERPGSSTDPLPVRPLPPPSPVEVVEVVDVDHLLDPPPRPVADLPAEPEPCATPLGAAIPLPPALPDRIPLAVD